MSTYLNKKISELFQVKSGDYHATKELDPGDVPLISCGDTSNGFIGYFDIPAERTYRRAITVAYNGSWPLLSKFHPYTFGAKDDVAVLIPRAEFQDATLFYIAAMLNRNTWRYSYGRKCFREKLMKFEVPVPVRAIDGQERIDEAAIRSLAPVGPDRYLPAKSSDGISKIPSLQWKDFSILDLFEIERGDFHSIASLDPGTVMTVSRVTEDNGVVGYYDPPDGARLYGSSRITVSTVGGDSFVQLGRFIATDNVVVCAPKNQMRVSTLFFIAFILNRQRWRYSYGRQCYKTKLAMANIPLPVDAGGHVDEDTIESIVEQASYWKQITTVDEAPLLRHIDGACSGGGTV